MPNLHAPGRTVALSGGPRQVVFSTRMLMALEDRFGSYADLNSQWDSKEGSTTAAVLGVALRIADEDAADLIDGAGVRPVKSVLIDALNDAIGGPGDENVDPTTPASPIPGTTS